LSGLFAGKKIAVETDRRPLLVFFRNARSGPARRMESLIAHVARKERSRLKVREIDVDEQAALAERFHIETVPTLVLVKDKRVVGRLEGRVSAPRIERMLAAHLDVAAA
jgi:thioredoxin-like negative regulator of GroEL